MLTKSQIKLITQLKQKKYRDQQGFFIAEGAKTINELLQSPIKLHHLYTTRPLDRVTTNASLVTETELKKISFFSTPNQAVAIFEIPKEEPIDISKLIVALDDVRDPGNLGTIIRLCDWFGIENLVCSYKTVDCFNPKVVQATMGSIARVHINYVNLETFLLQVNTTLFGAFINGKSVYKQKLPEKGILVLGNEAQGISKNIESIIDKKISIPQFEGLQTSESLNVATATAILLSEFRRNSY